MPDLSIMNIRGVDYNIADAKCRSLVKDLAQQADLYKQGILELASTMSSYIQKTNIAIDNSDVFPILSFTNLSSIYIDISMLANTTIYSTLVLIKHMKQTMYTKVLDSSPMLNMYYQLHNDNCYVFFEPKIKSDINIDIYGIKPRISVDEVFIKDNYPKAIAIL